MYNDLFTENDFLLVFGNRMTTLLTSVLEQMDLSAKSDPFPLTSDLM